MHLYKNKSFILLFLPLVLSISNDKLKVSRKALGDLSPCSIGLQFLVEVNNTSADDDFEVELKPDECCLETHNDVDCESLEIIGACHAVVPRGSTKSFTLIAPLLDPYQRQGYCNVFLDSSADREKYIMRDKVSINFETKIDDIEDSNIAVCEQIDQDPLNKCKPVDCDTYYNDHKPHYDKNKQRCVRSPICMYKIDKKYPVMIFNPISNECTDNVITSRDINSIKTLNKRKRSRFPKDIVIIRNNDNDKDSLSYNDTFSDSIYEMPPDPLQSPSKYKKIKAKCAKPIKKISKKGKHAFLFGVKQVSRLTLIGLLIIIFIQCCVIFSMIYCLIKKYKYWKQNKNGVNTYYNYRHDASVTTPLIDTSNIDTNTNHHYSSESSANIHHKGKHYKSIPKDESDNVKKSLSDDILSKCINRRNWIRNTKYFSAPNNSIHASNAPRDGILQGTENLDNKTHTHYQTNFTMRDSQRSSITKLDFENEGPSKAELINKTVSNLRKSLNKMTLDSRLSSEKEIKCTSYNNAYSKSSEMDVIRKQSPTNVGYLEMETYSPESIEKSAQAYFSNDSIDDFISERGMMFFAGDDTSKYTLSSDSIPVHASSCSGTSNKTSKNNIVSNVLSLLRMRSKHGTNSDPGVKSTDKSLDVQILHISTNSVYSSTNNEMEMLVNGRNIVSESRTSL